MALEKRVLVAQLGVDALYWRIESVSSDRRRKHTVVILSGYPNADIAAAALTDQGVRPLDSKTVVLTSDKDPLLEEGTTAIGFSYEEIKRLPEWSDAQDV